VSGNAIPADQRRWSVADEMLAGDSPTGLDGALKRAKSRASKLGRPVCVFTIVEPGDTQAGKETRRRASAARLAATKSHR
jgi:hypothetical protein